MIWDSVFDIVSFRVTRPNKTVLDCWWWKFLVFYECGEVLYWFCVPCTKPERPLQVLVLEYLYYCLPIDKQSLRFTSEKQDRYYEWLVYIVLCNNFDVMVAPDTVQVYSLAISVVAIATLMRICDVEHLCHIYICFDLPMTMTLLLSVHIRSNMFFCLLWRIFLFSFGSCYQMDFCEM